MFRQLIIIILFLFAFKVNAQSGFGPVANCSFPIPEICPNALYPSGTTGTATAAGGSFLCPGSSNGISMNPSFFYFEAGASGSIDILIEPIDPFTGSVLPNPQDLDFICWGPFNSTANMCSQLQVFNRIDCSYSPNASETCNIPTANIGDIFVILVSNWADPNPPNFCNIRFSADTSNGGIANPFSGGGFAGANASINVCSTDPPFSMLSQLNGFPNNWGSWVDANNNPVIDTFDPSVNTAGVYRYIINGTNNCPGDTAFLTINLISSSNVYITSSPNSCSDDSPLTLTATPSGGIFSGNGVSGNIFTPNINLIGSNTITYTYTSGGCTISATQDLVVNESPFVDPINVTTSNPTCFGYSDGSANIIATGGAGNYTYNWFGQSPSALPSGTHNYQVIDANNCTFSGSIILYDPVNNIAQLTPYNSSCFGDNNGAIAISMLGATTPPGTISTLNYCNSSPNTDPFFANQAATIIEEVSLIGDNNNISNNTSGLFDLYEDYTTLYADITEGGSYVVNVTPGNQQFGSTSYDPGQINVYIDFNIDGDFDDIINGISEDIGVVNIAPGTFTPGTPYSFNINVPVTGAYGATRMRVVCIDQSSVGSGANIDDCTVASGLFGTTALPWWGATEDYSIVLNAPTINANYLWGNGATGDSIYNLSPGTYSVIITPSSGCPVQDSATITESNQITFNPNISNVSCNSLTDGVINLSPSGGMDNNYTINWYGADPLALDDGIYNITVTDNYGCSNDTTITITEPDYFGANFSIADDEICLNENSLLNFDFSVGGFAPFVIDYNINGIAQTPIIANNSGNFNQTISPLLGNNIYNIVTIIDANGCPIQNNINPDNIFVNPNPDIGISISGNNPICFGDSSSLFFTNFNGTPPFNVAYNINGVYETQNVIASGNNIVVNPNITTTYTLDSVADSKGCTSYLNDNVTIIVNEIPQLNWSVPNNVCDEEVVQLKFEFTAGNSPWYVNYAVNNNNYSIPLINSVDSISISPSSTSTYSLLSISDNNNCFNNINEAITITTYPLPSGTISGGGSLCDDGSTTDIMINTSSGTPPFTLVYGYGVNTETIANIGVSYNITTNQSGVYSILDIIDSQGCRAKDITGSASVSVNPIPNANISAFPQIVDMLEPTINFTDNSNGHSTGFWDFGDGNISSTNFGEIQYTYLDTGSYQVKLTIESDSGCINVASQTVIVSPIYTIYIPNAFTPNNDFDNNIFLPIVIGAEEYELSIYNRHGQRIFYTNDIAEGWDGFINNGNQFAIKGVYIYSIVLKDNKGKVKTYEGQVSLIR